MCSGSGDPIVAFLAQQALGGPGVYPAYRVPGGPGDWPMALSTQRAAASAAAPKTPKALKQATQPRAAEADLGLEDLSALVAKGMMLQARPSLKSGRAAAVAVIPLPDGRTCILCEARDTDDDEVDASRVMMWAPYWRKEQ